MKTPRGFERIIFTDDYGARCSIQESSSVEPHIWLGVHTIKPLIMAKDAEALGDEPMCRIDGNGGVGWYDVIFNEKIQMFSRMHLTRKQAKWVADKLMEFYYTEKITDNGDYPNE